MNSGALHKGDRIKEFFASIASRYDLANHLLSGGCDFIWRRLAARQIRSWTPGTILDIATGSGDLAIELRKACPDARVVGADFCRPMLLEAKRKRQGNLIESDALQLPFRTGTFDAITIAFGLRNMESWRGVLTECARVLAPGGHLLVLDFSVPTGITRGIYRLYLHQVLPRVAALVTREKTAYSYLADSIEAFPQGDTMVEIFRTVGFRNTTHRPLHTGIVTIYTGEKVAP